MEELAVIAPELDTIDWTREDYVIRIKQQMASSLVVVCTLLSELKSKFFSDELDHGKTWTAFCKERLGMSRQAVAGYLRIDQYVLPRLEESVVNDLGTKKLLELARLQDDSQWDEVVDQIDPDMNLKQVKEVVQRFLPEKKKKKENLKKTPAQLRKTIETLNSELSAFLPDNPNDPDAKKKYKELCNELFNSMGPLQNILQMMIATADE